MRRGEFVAFHVQLDRGRLFSGEQETLWNLNEQELHERILGPRKHGHAVWVGGVEFRWEGTKAQIFAGPQTQEIPDYTPILGPAAYSFGGLLTDVTDEYISGPAGNEMEKRTSVETIEELQESVFLVHGRSIARKEETARFLEQVLPTDQRLVILGDLPHEGQTLLEKFERAATTTGFAVVLLTPDDEGRLVGDRNWEGRARQNVIFELGFFFGKLGRGRVSVLHETGVSSLSDISGLGHIPLDSTGGWKLQLVRELKAAGISASLDRII
jgi:predicted nucleotide-binding protein